MVRPFNGKTELYIVVGLKNTLGEMLEDMDRKQIIAVDFDGTLCFSTWQIQENLISLSLII